MISALAWMPRGKAKAVPTKYEPTEEEMEEMRKAAEELEKTGDDEEDWEDMSEDGSDGEQEAAVSKAKKAARAACAAADDDLAEYNLDDYDKEPGDTIGIFGRGLSHFQDNSEDPYITLPDAADDSEEEDDNIIRPTDSIILACHSEEDGHTLEVYVFDYEQGSLFVHHDLMLNAFPLCVEWLDTARKDGTAGSFAALGTMDTAIEVWDLDCIDSLVPAAILGGEDQDAPAAAAGAAAPKGKKKKKKETKKPLREGSHREAVLGLSWNRLQRHVLASASADKSVKIWDVPRETCLHTLTHHAGKVQALQWHPTQAAALLSGGFDRRAAVVDVRAAAADWRAAARWELSADVECVAWDPHSDGHLFLVSTDDGTVVCHDARKAGAAPVFTIGAHAEAATGLALNARVPGLIATCSLDKTVKLWDIRGGRADCVASRGMDIGQVFTVSFCDDAELPYVLAAGGRDGKVAVWDAAASAAVRARFPTGKTEADYLADDDIGLARMSLAGGGGGGGRDSDDDSDEEGGAGAGARKGGAGGGGGGGGGKKGGGAGGAKKGGGAGGAGAGAGAGSGGVKMTGKTKAKK